MEGSCNLQGAFGQWPNAARESRAPPGTSLLPRPFEKALQRAHVALRGDHKTDAAVAAHGGHPFILLEIKPAVGRGELHAEVFRLEDVKKRVIFIDRDL